MNEVRLEAATGQPIRCQDCVRCADEMFALAESDAAQLLARADHRAADLLREAGWHPTDEHKWTDPHGSPGDPVDVNQALAVVLLERLWRPLTS